MYFDADGDLDLSNDPPLASAPILGPTGSGPADDKEERFHFKELSVPMDFGATLGVRPVKMLPLLFVSQKKSATLMFVHLTYWGGRIQIGKQSFDALLAQPHLISGRFDRTWTGIYLAPRGTKAFGSGGGERIAWVISSQ